MEPITLLIFFLVAIVVLAIIWYVLGMTELPAPVRNIILLVAALLVLLWMLGKGGLF